MYVARWGSRRAHADYPASEPSVPARIADLILGRVRRLPVRHSAALPFYRREPGRLILGEEGVDDFVKRFTAYDFFDFV